MKHGSTVSAGVTAKAKWYWWKEHRCYVRHYSYCNNWYHRRNEYNSWKRDAANFIRQADNAQRQVDPTMKKKIATDKANTQLQGRITALKMEQSSFATMEKGYEDEMKRALETRAKEVSYARRVTARLESEAKTLKLLNLTESQLSQRITDLKAASASAEASITKAEKDITVTASKAGTDMGMSKAEEIGLSMDVEETELDGEAELKQIKALRTSVESLQSRVNATRDEVASLAAKREALAHEHDSITAESMSLQDQITVLRAEYERTAELRRTAEENSRLAKSDQDEVEAKSRSAASKASTLREELERVGKAKRETDVSFEAMTSRVAELADRRHMLEQHLATLVNASAVLSRKHSLLEGIYESARANASTVEEALEGARARLATIAAKVSTAEHEAAHSKHQADSEAEEAQHATVESLAMKNAASKRHIDLVSAAAEGLMGGCDCSEDADSCSLCGPSSKSNVSGGITGEISSSASALVESATELASEMDLDDKDKAVLQEEIPTPESVNTSDDGGMGSTNPDVESAVKAAEDEAAVEAEAEEAAAEDLSKEREEAEAEQDKAEAVGAAEEKEEEDAAGAPAPETIEEAVAADAPRFREMSGSGSSSSTEASSQDKGKTGWWWHRYCHRWSDRCHNYWKYDRMRHQQLSARSRAIQRRNIANNRYNAAKSQLRMAEATKSSLIRVVSTLSNRVAQHKRTIQQHKKKTEDLKKEVENVQKVMTEAMKSLAKTSEAVQKEKFSVEDASEERSAQAKVAARATHQLQTAEKVKEEVEVKSAKGREEAREVEEKLKAELTEEKEKLSQEVRERIALQLDEDSTQSKKAAAEDAKAQVQRQVEGLKETVDMDKEHEEALSAEKLRLEMDVKANLDAEGRAKAAREASEMAVEAATGEMDGARTEMRAVRGEMQRLKAGLHAQAAAQAISGGDAFEADRAVRRLEDTVASKENDVEQEKHVLNHMAEETARLRNAVIRWRTEEKTLEQARDTESQRAAAAEELKTEQREAAEHEKHELEKADASRDELATSRGLLPRTPVEQLDALKKKRAQLEEMLGGRHASLAKQLISHSEEAAKDAELTAEDITKDLEVDEVIGAADDVDKQQKREETVGTTSPGLSEDLKKIGKDTEKDEETVEDIVKDSTVEPDELPGTTGSHEVEAILTGNANANIPEDPSMASALDDSTDEDDEDSAPPPGVGGDGPEGAPAGAEDGGEGPPE